jgi:hypothetical protein
LAVAVGTQTAPGATVFRIGPASEELAAGATSGLVGQCLNQCGVQLAPAIDLTQDGVGQRAFIPAKTRPAGDNPGQVVQDALRCLLGLISLDEWSEVFGSPALGGGELAELFVGRGLHATVITDSLLSGVERLRCQSLVGLLVRVDGVVYPRIFSTDTNDFIGKI